MEEAKHEEPEKLKQHSLEDQCCNTLDSFFYNNIERVDDIVPLIIERGSLIDPEFYFSEEFLFLSAFLTKYVLCAVKGQPDATLDATLAKQL
jgi:hypothetical protein